MTLVPRTTPSTLLEPHPLSNIFPPMSDDDFNELVTDIKTNGLQQPIVCYQSKILDGIHRSKACNIAGCKPTFVEFKGTDKEAEAFVISANIRRRHLNPEQRRNIIGKLLTANPGASDRAIAAQAKVSPTTVGEVRKTTVQSGQLRTGLDGKKRKVTHSKGGEISKGKKVKQVEVFKRMWEDFEDWQQRSFVKLFKDRLAELLEEVESEADASAEVPELEVA